VFRYLILNQLFSQPTLWYVSTLNWALKPLLAPNTREEMIPIFLMLSWDHLFWCLYHMWIPWQVFYEKCTIVGYRWSMEPPSFASLLMFARSCDPCLILHELIHKFLCYKEVNHCQPNFFHTFKLLANPNNCIMPPSGDTNSIIHHVFCQPYLLTGGRLDRAGTRIHQVLRLLCTQTQCTTENKQNSYRLRWTIYNYM